MKRRHAWIVLGVGILFLGGAYYGIAHIVHPKSWCVSCNSFLRPITKQRIKKLVHNRFIRPDGTCMRAKDLITFINKRFNNTVYNVTVHYGWPQHAHISVMFYEPQCIVNNKYLYLQDGHRLSLDICDARIKSPSIIAPYADTMGTEEIKALCTFVAHVPEQILRDYIITWYDETRIELQSREEKYRIKIAASTLLDTEFFRAIHWILGQQKYACIDARYDDFFVATGK